jgi:hypothetical protein
MVMVVSPGDTGIIGGGEETEMNQLCWFVFDWGRSPKAA